MITKIEDLLAELKNISINNADDLENFRLTYLSKKGKINILFDDFKLVPNEEKKIIGAKLNILKNEASQIFENFKSLAENKTETILNDIFAPAEPFTKGSRHPINLVKNQLVDIFKRLGFTIENGPEIEDDWHVFSALNFPQNHPARDMQDTFFVKKNPDILLRTHTSSVQVRVMKEQKPPIRSIMPGRVYRNEVISARSHCAFHQIEGLYIDKDVSFADLKQTLLYFAQELFGTSTTIRLRPSYFPFTEPSAEMDVSCTICGGKGCNLCKHTGWLEILGCGMVDPNVLTLSNINPEEYTGFAFGLGLERLALLLYQINDIRLYFENDVRFLKQF
jgi:phenylalanyl-tRNA synthetase alpha chain